ncbi:MAG: type II secretion system protein GspE [Deltaproteobacteria bacterium]|nr:MAG: type II secretion system protein GspE [Deltaproteobacteria bacterium]
MLESQPSRQTADLTSVGPAPEELAEEDIFASVEHTEFATYPSGRYVGLPLEEVLFHQDVISSDQVDQFRVLAEDRGEPIETIMLASKTITEAQLLLARSEHFDIPYCHQIDTKLITPELLNKVPLSFARQSRILPLVVEFDTVYIACADPYDVETFDQLRMLLQAEPLPLLASATQIVTAINQAYDFINSNLGLEDAQEELEDVGTQSEYADISEAVDLLDVGDDEAPVIRLVNALIYRAVKEAASDIHIEPFEKEVRVRFRVDGLMYEVTQVPKRAHSHITARVKIMSQLDIAEKRIPQDGRIRLKIAGKDIDLRVSTIPTAHGERIVMRLLDKSNTVLDLEVFGFSDDMLKQFLSMIHRSHGIIPVTGPTGSGKTTTLYAALSRINSPEKNILTVEDPVEYQLRGIGQMQVNSKINLTFASGLRAFLRQDPDVILVGETRDLETAEIAIQASLTGHLVFTTLHTNDAATAFTRLIDMGVEPFLVASSVVGVLAQRLVRKLCKECKEPYEPTSEQLSQVGLTPEKAAGHTLYHDRDGGCEACSFSGYSGRMGIYELLTIDDEIRSMVIRNETSGAIKQRAAQKGMKSLRDDGAAKVLQGITSIEEISRVTQEDL